MYLTPAAGRGQVLEQQVEERAAETVAVALAHGEQRQVL